MAKTTIVFGILLIALGIVGYMGGGSAAAPKDGQAKDASADQPAADQPAADQPAADQPAPKKSITALIPAFVGVILALCGVLALKESMLKHAMHGAVLVGLLGAIAGAGRGVMGLGKFFSGDPSLNQRSFLFVWLMAVICGVFVFLCVQSFIAARKRKELEKAQQGS